MARRVKRRVKQRSKAHRKWVKGKQKRKRNAHPKVGYGAKKLIDWNRERKTNPRFPASATPAQRNARTNSL